MPQAHISDLIAKEQCDQQYVSFEFYPPRTDKAEEEMMQVNMPLFAAQHPVFVDLTWGAGGSTSDKTMRLCADLKNKHNLIANMHVTCTNMPKGLVKQALDFCRDNGITNIVALRGDPPAGQEWQANEEGFHCARDLVAYIRAEYGDYFCITVAGYPEGHPNKIDAASGRISEADMVSELQYLKEKMDAGASLIITQLFYDADVFIRFVKRCREIGITAPILPGLLPFGGYASFQRMVKLCKTYVPEAMAKRVEAIKDDEAQMKAYGVEYTTHLINEIKAADIGVNHFHFYTINSPESTFKVLQSIGLYIA